METKATTYDVFISHAHQDSTLAETIAEKLRAYQLQVFTDAQVETASLTEEALLASYGREPGHDCSHLDA